MSGFSNIADGIEEFNETMKKVIDLVEDANSILQTIDQVGLGEGSAKVQGIEDLCESAKEQLDQAIDIAEDLRKLLG